MQRVFLIILACLALVVVGCGDDSDTATTSGGETTAREETQGGEETGGEEEAEAPELPEPKVPAGSPPKQLEIIDVESGSGKAAKAGEKVSVYYVGVVYKTKEQFDANWDSGEPFTFSLGAGEVIKGWDQGVQGMKVGGERELIIPPNLAYGPEAIYPSIPANSTLVFLVKRVK
ncbi:MAG TPA: FKBP-type peptidyl-prolyl cis-trans isomerase [Solirubrobacterales bacterium]|nr:FKBP-type peptidyl-prolyl cis-trans isomerase [Solirubrobacterales bacterium]